MRVLQVTTTYIPELKFGGPPQKIHSLGSRLVDRGHRVGVLTFDSQNSRGHTNHRVIEGVAVEHLAWRGWGLRQWPMDGERINAAIENADVVHCYGLYNFLCPTAARVARKKGRPYVIEPLGMYRPRARNILAKRLYHWLFTRQLFANAARVIATSALEAIELKGVIAESRLVLRRNGIDVDAFHKLPPPAGFRNKFAIQPDERVVLFLGRISPIKNLEALMRAFGNAKLANCRLVLAGPENEPEYAAGLRGLSQSLGLNGKIIFAGPLFDTPKLEAFAAAELFVLPSLSESYGNAAAEAVAAGVPVLLTETCGIARCLHQRAGLAVSTDPESLRTGLQVMLDPERRQSFICSRAEVKQELSWDEPVVETEALYKKIRREVGTE